jgi:hypothetical protein
MILTKKIFITIIVIVAILVVLGITGQMWAKSLVIIITYMPLVFLSAFGVGGLFHEQPDVIFASPTIPGLFIMIIVDLALAYLAAMILSKIIRKMRKTDEAPKI